MNFNELKKTVQEQYRKKEIANEYGIPITVKNWKETNAFIRKQLKLNGVRCKTAFYNPNDQRVYIKQTFRKVMYGGVEQVENTFEDVLYFVCSGNEKHIKGYWDDEYITVPINLF